MWARHSPNRPLSLFFINLINLHRIQHIISIPCHSICHLMHQQIPPSPCLPQVLPGVPLLRSLRRIFYTKISTCKRCSYKIYTTHPKLREIDTTEHAQPAISKGNPSPMPRRIPKIPMTAPHIFAVRSHLEVRSSGPVERSREIWRL